MRKIQLTVVFALALTASMAQSLPGFRTSNYSGVNGVFYNPANTADSKYKYDVNVLAIDMLVANNKASFDLANITDNFKDDGLRDNFLTNGAGASSGLITLDIHGPSFLLNIDHKNAFALTTRVRAFANVLNIDGKLLNQLSDDVNPDSDLPYRISSTENMRLAVNAWSEIGLTYGRVLVNSGEHFLKGGLTLKYLAGVGNGFININNFNATLDADLIAESGFVTDATGKVATGFGGINISSLEADDLTNFNGSGFGTDLGLIYEYRPDAAGNAKNAGNNYKFKFGFSLLDLGKIKYDKDPSRSGAYSMNIPANQKLYLNDLNELDDYNSFFKNHPQFFTPAASNTETTYSVSLPASMQLEADYHINNGFFLNLASQISLSNSNDKVYNNVNYSTLTLTPRFETRAFGAYLPLNYNSLSKFNAGLCLRAGPLFVGSGSLFTALVGESKQADIFLGIRFGGLR